MVPRIIILETSGSNGFAPLLAVWHGTRDPLPPKLLQTEAKMFFRINNAAPQKAKNEPI